MLNNVLFLIVARSGSKSVPDKNIKLLNGLPLMAHRIRQALEISIPENVLLSTDDSIYAKIGKKYGAKVPFLRPKELATDYASSSDVVRHAMNYFEDNHRKLDAVALLEPTSPFVTTSKLLDAIRLLMEDSSADAVVATKESKTHSNYIQQESKYLEELYHKFKSVKNLRRQDQPTEITPAGGFYISKWDAFNKHNSFYTKQTLSYRLEGYMTLEIDTPEDFAWAEYIVKMGLHQKG